MVSEENIEKILTMLQDVADQKRKLEDEMDETVKGPTTEETVENDPLIETLDSLTAAIEEQKGFVRQSLENNFLDVASYQLQECEQIMRGLIGIMPKLEKGRQESVAQIYSDLKALSDEVSDKKSEAVWTKYKAEHDSFMGANREVIACVSPAWGEGLCQTQITRIQKQIMVLQQIMPSLSPKYLEDVVQGTDKNTAAGLLRELQDKLQEAATRQSQAYNTWALNQIQAGLGECNKAEGVIANGKEGTGKIENALVECLGVIDLQYLTNEVSRCYQEVLNKYLSDTHLYKVKDESDFNKNGTVLHTLKSMNEQKRTKLSQF